MRPTPLAALRAERGMTIVELLIVLILIAILILIGFSSYRTYQERANDAAAKKNIYNLLPAISSYYVENETYTGMTFAGLKSTYNAGIDPGDYTFGSSPPSDSAYCVQSSSGDRTWRKNGPTAALERQSCP